MALRDIFKISRKTFLNPSGWIDLEGLKQQNRTIWTILKNLFSPPTPIEKETFEQAMTRLRLTEEDVQSAKTTYRLYAIFFLSLGLIVILYAFYLLFHHGTFTGWVLAVASAALFLSQAFKYDFWAFQLRRRKLGATFEEWKNSLLGHKGRRHD